MNYSAKLKVMAAVSTFLMVMSTPTAWPEGQESDGSTVIAAEINPLDKYRGAKSLTDMELIDLLSLVGFKGNNLKVAWATVMKESRGHPLSHNNNVATGDNSYGLFQINMFGSLGESRRERFHISSNEELLDPVTNAQAAFYMTHGTDFGSWGYGPNAYDGTPGEPALTAWFNQYPTK